MIIITLSLLTFGLKTNTKPEIPEDIAAKQADHDSIEARSWAKIYVDKLLKASTTAKWPSGADFGVNQYKDKKGKVVKDVWEVSGYVDVQNSFGAMIRTQWYVKLKKTGNSWIILLEIKS